LVPVLIENLPLPLFFGAKKNIQIPPGKKQEQKSVLAAP
jgi:hypothetical protein